MKTNCFVRPAKRAMSVSMWSGVKAIQSTTASKVWSAKACLTDSGSLMSPRSTVTPSGVGRDDFPRLR